MSNRFSSIAKRSSRHGRPLLVLKVGTSSLVVSDSNGHRVRLALVSQLVEVIAELRQRDYQVVLISSGAVGMGCMKLGIPKPQDLRKKQTVAAAGQSQLMRMYEDLFGTIRIQVAQLLLSQGDFAQKEHWSNVKVTIMECLSLGVVPIINENDSTNTAELRFGDNDNLAALTAVQLEADALCLFTDVSCVYTANPRTNPDAKPLFVVPEPWALKVETKDAGSGLGTGGMSTKILAARTASVSGIPCLLINSSFPRRILALLDYVPNEDPEALPEEATYFMAMDAAQTVHDTRRWILSLPVSGQVELDKGAAKALGSKKSLLAAGVTEVQGSFLRNEALRICHEGNEIARGIINFSSEELSKIMGHSSHRFEDLLGFSCCTEACYRNNIILTTSADSLQNIEVPLHQRRMSRDYSRNFVPSELLPGKIREDLSEKIRKEALSVGVDQQEGTSSDSPTATCKESGNLKITLLVFSGRPDPQWEVLPTDPNHDRIKQLLDSARDQGFIYPIRKMQSRLGFKGFLIQNTAKKNKDPELIVGPDTVQLQQILLQSLPEGTLSEDFRKKISEEIKLTPSP